MGLLCLILTECVYSYLSLDVLNVESEVDSQWNSSYLKALDGFLMVLSNDGDIVYLSENVSKCLGIPQVSSHSHWKSFLASFKMLTDNN